MLASSSEGRTRTPWKRNPDGTVLGAEIDHLRLYGMRRQHIAAHLGCSVDAVEKWVKAHPEPHDPWEVSA